MQKQARNKEAEGDLREQVGIVGGEGSKESKEVFVAFGVQLFLLSKGTLHFGELRLQPVLFLLKCFKRGPIRRTTGNRGNGCLWPLL